MPQPVCHFLAALFLSVLCFSSTFSHGHEGPRALAKLEWQADHIARTVTAGFPDSFSLFAFNQRVPEKIINVAGRACIKANFLAFDIRDDYAYDLDESVTVELQFLQQEKATILYGYDRSGLAEATGTLDLSASDKLQAVSVELERARFANRGMDGTDFALITEVALSPPTEEFAGQSGTLTLCGIKIMRSNRVAAAVLEPEDAVASVNIQFIDQISQQTVPVRLGIYDESGRMVLPNRQALDVDFYGSTRKQLVLRNTSEKNQPWWHANRHFFYSDGRYALDLPAGQYSLIASKGPEYRAVNHSFRIESGKALQLDIPMQRWVNMRERGWYSGDVHIHMNRSPDSNAVVAKVLQAEDLHLSNLLQMSNVTSSYFRQYAWGDKGQYHEHEYSIAPGIEGPRTAQRGHTISLNIQQPMEDQDHYFLYHRFLEHYQKQNAVTGYAHVGSEEFLASRGLALDVPFGLVDFVEVMQFNQLRTELWYELLNVGYRVSPAAGSDFPYFDQPGAVRSYVKIPEETKSGQQKTERWFEGLKAGNTFVTNGPMLELSVSGKPMGSALKVSSNEDVQVVASARMNPDIDQLDKLELILCGEVVKTVRASHPHSDVIELDYALPADGSMWLAVRASGKTAALSHSAAVYIEDNNGRSWCESRVEATIATLRGRLSLLHSAAIKPRRELEYWDIKNLEAIYQAQLPALQQRISEADSQYEQLLSSFKRQQ